MTNWGYLQAKSNNPLESDAHYVRAAQVQRWVSHV